MISQKPHNIITNVPKTSDNDYRPPIMGPNTTSHANLKRLDLRPTIHAENFAQESSEIWLLDRTPTQWLLEPRNRKVY